MKVYADFQNSDPFGRLRLNCVGTIEDLARQQISLVDGRVLVLYCEDLEVDGIVQFSEDENIWVAAIDWNLIQNRGLVATRDRIHAA